MTTHHRRSAAKRALTIAGAGISVLAVLTASGCSAPQPTVDSATTDTASMAPQLPSGDTSNGADNFYTSDRVTVEKVTFKNQYRMYVIGNLFVPKTIDRNVHESGDGRRTPDGSGQGAERQPLRDQDGRAGIRHPVPRPVLLGRERRRAPQRRPAGHLRRGLQRRGRLPAHPVHSSTGSGSAPLGICGSGSFVISAAKIDPRIKAVATVSMYDMGGVNRNGLRNSVTPEQRQAVLGASRSSSATSSSPAVKPNTPAGPLKN